MVIPPPVIEDLVPTPETSRRDMPPPPSAVVSAPASVLPAVPMDAQGGVANAGDAAMAPAPKYRAGGASSTQSGCPGSSYTRNGT